MLRAGDGGNGFVEGRDYSGKSYPYVVVNGVRYCSPQDVRSKLYVKQQFDGKTVAYVMANMFRRDRGKQDLDDALTYWRQQIGAFDVVRIQRRKTKKEDPVIYESAKPDTIVHTKDRLIVLRHLHERAIPGDLPTKVIYEDERCVAVVKPPGISCEDKPKCYNHMNGVFNYCVRPRRWPESALSDKTQEYWSHVHRLDRPVSGVLVIAKSSGNKRRELGALIKARKVTKTYLARVQGDVRTAWSSKLRYWAMKKVKRDAPFGCTSVPGTEASVGGKTLKSTISVRVCIPIPFDTRTGRARASEVSAAKVSDTTFHFLRSFKDGTHLVQCALHTGHKHQIRAHLDYLGTCIANDTLYGGTRKPCGHIRRILVDDSADTLKRFFSESYRKSCSQCEWIRRTLDGRVDTSKPFPFVGEGIWLYAKRYQFPTLKIDIVAPDPNFAIEAPDTPEG